MPIAALPLHWSAFSSSFVAEVAEVFLVDLKGPRQGHGYRFEVGVARGGVEIELQARILAAGGRLSPAELGDRHLR